MTHTKLLLTFTVAAMLAAAAPAPATPLHAHRVSPTASWVGTADATVVAYKPDRGPGVVLRSDDGSARTVAAPDGCAITAAGSGMLASSCGQSDFLPDGNSVMSSLAVSRLDGTLVARFDVRLRADGANVTVPGMPVAVGKQWIRLPDGGKQAGHWWTDVNWQRPGRVALSGETDGVMVDDLDDDELQEPLCAPLRRTWRGDPDMDNLPGYFAADVRGRWVLLENADGHTLHHCGLTRPVTLPKGFQPRVLGDGWVAGFTPVAHRSPRIDVVRLSDRHRFAVAGVPRANIDLALTNGRLYAHGEGIFTVKLPRR
jgi:hypothetical protein